MAFDGETGCLVPPLLGVRNERVAVIVRRDDVFWSVLALYVSDMRRLSAAFGAGRSYGWGRIWMAGFIASSVCTSHTAIPIIFLGY